MSVAQKVMGTSHTLPTLMVERMYWEHMELGSMEVCHGGDARGTAFSKSPKDPLGMSDWNLNVRSIES